MKMCFNLVHLLGIKVCNEVFTMYCVLCNSVWTCFIVIDVQNDFLTHILNSNLTMVKKSYFCKIFQVLIRIVVCI